MAEVLNDITTSKLVTNNESQKQLADILKHILTSNYIQLNI